MYKQGDYIEALSTGNTNRVLSVTKGRDKVFRPAPPPSEHLVACLGFLRRIASVHITGGDKKQFEISVQLNAAANDPDSAAAAFTITRTANDVKLLELDVQGASNHHPALSPVYNLQPCAMCEGVKRLDSLPVKTSHRVLHSTESLRKIMESGLEGLIQASLVPPTNTQLYCEGLQRVPSAITSFLLRGVDQTQL